MKTFFKPNSIAVVGASTRKIGYQIIKNLLYGYKGKIYPVNPNYPEIEGIPCFSSLEDIPNPVAVRFAWDQLAEPNLMNKEGLPASSFRTDDWELLPVPPRPVPAPPK